MEQGRLVETQRTSCPLHTRGTRWNRVGQPASREQSDPEGRSLVNRSSLCSNACSRAESLVTKTFGSDKITICGYTHTRNEMRGSSGISVEETRHLEFWNMLLFLSSCYRTFTEFCSRSQVAQSFCIINLFVTEAPNKETSISSKNNRILP